MAQDTKVIEVIAQLKDEFSGVAKKITESLGAMDKTLQGLAKVQLSPKLTSTLKHLEENGKGAAEAINKLNAQLKGGALPTSLGNLQQAAQAASKELKDLSHRSLVTTSLTKKTKSITVGLNNITAAARTAREALQNIPDVSRLSKAEPKTAQTSKQDVSAKEKVVEVTNKQTTAEERLQKQLDRQSASYNKLSNSLAAVTQTSEHLTNTTKGLSDKERNLGIEIRSRDALQQRSITLIGEAIGLQNQLQTVEKGTTEALKTQSNALRDNVTELIKKLEAQRALQQATSLKLKEKQEPSGADSVNVKSLEQLVTTLQKLKGDVSSVTSQVSDIAAGFEKAHGSASKLNSTVSSYSKETTRVLNIQQEINTAIGQGKQIEGDKAKTIVATLNALKQELLIKKELIESNSAAAVSEKAKVVATEEHLTALTKVKSQVEQNVKAQNSLVELSQTLTATDDQKVKNHTEINKQYKKQEASISRIAELQQQVSSLGGFKGADAKSVALLKELETQLNKIAKTASTTKTVLGEGLKVDKDLAKATTEASNFQTKLEGIEKEYKDLKSTITASTGKIQIFRDEDLILAKTRVTGLNTEVLRFLKSMEKLAADPKGRKALKDFGLTAEQVQGTLGKLGASVGKLKADLSAFSKERSVEFGESIEAVKAGGRNVASSLQQMTVAGATLGKSVEGALQNMGKRFGVNTVKARELAGAISHLEEEMVRFRSGVVTWSTGLLMLGAAVTAPFYQAIKVFTELSDTLAQVQAVTNATVMEFRHLEEAATTMGRTTRFTAQQAAEGLLFLGRAGFAADEAVAALPTTLQMAQAAAIDLGRAADIVTNIMTSFSLEISQLPHAADVLTQAFTSSNATLENLGVGFTYVGSIAKGLGTDFEDVIGALAKLHDAGFKGTMAGTALRGALDGLFNPTKQEAKVMEELGDRLGFVDLQIRNASGGFVGFSALIQQLETAGFTAEEALKLFGQRAGPGMAALLRIGSKNLEDYKESLEEAGGTTAEIAAIMDTTLKGAFLRLKSAVEGLGESFGKGIEEGLKIMVDALSSAVNTITDFKESLGPVGDIIGVVVGGLAALIGVIGSATFAWFLMLVPLKQFAVAFGSLIGLFRAGTERLLGLDITQKNSIGTSVKAAAAIAKESVERAKALQGIDIESQRLHINTLAQEANNRSKLNKPIGAGVIPAQHIVGPPIPDIKTAQVKGYNVGEAASAAMAKGAKKGIGPFRSIFTDVFKNLTAIAVYWGTSFLGPIGIFFQLLIPQAFELVKGVGSVREAIDLAKVALLGLIKVLKAHPILLAISAIVTAFYLFKDSVKAANNETQRLIDKTAGFGGKAKKSVNTAIQAFNELKNLDVEQLFSQVGNKALDSLQESLLNVNDTLIQTIRNLGEFGEIPELDVEIVPVITENALPDLFLEVKGGKSTRIFTDDIEKLKAETGEAKKVMQDLAEVIERQTKAKIQSHRIDMAVRSLADTEEESIKKTIEALKEQNQLRKSAYDFQANSARFSGNKSEQQRLALLRNLEDDYSEKIKESIKLHRERGATAAQQLDLVNLSFEDAFDIITKVAQAQHDAAGEDSFKENTKSVEDYKDALIKLVKPYLKINGISKNLNIQEGFKKAVSAVNQIADSFEKVNETLEELKDNADDAIESLIDLEDSKFEIKIEGIDADLARDLDALSIAFSKLDASQNLSSYYSKDAFDRQRLDLADFYKNKNAVTERSYLLERNLLESSFAATKASLDKKRVAQQQYIETLKKNAVNSQKATLDAIQTSDAKFNPEEDKLVKIYKNEADEIIHVYQRLAGDLVEINKTVADKTVQIYEDSNALVGEAKRKTLEVEKEILEEEYEVTKQHLEDLIGLREKYVKRIQDTEKARLAFSKLISDAEKKLFAEDTSDDSFAKRKRAAELKHHKDKQRLLRINSEFATAAAAGDFARMERLAKESIKIVEDAKKLAEKQKDDPSALIRIDPMEEQLYKRSLARYRQTFNDSAAGVEQDAEDHIERLDTTIGELGTTLSNLGTSFTEISGAIRQTFDDEGGLQKLTDGMGNLTTATEKLIGKYQEILEHQQVMIDKQKKVNDLKSELGNVQDIGIAVQQIGTLAEQVKKLSDEEIDFTSEKGRERLVKFAKELDTTTGSFTKTIEGLRALNDPKLTQVAGVLEEIVAALGGNWETTLSNSNENAKEFQDTWEGLVEAFGNSESKISDVSKVLGESDTALKEDFIKSIESKGLLEFLDVVKTKFQDLGQLDLPDVDIETSSAVTNLGKVENAFIAIQKAASDLQKKFKLNVSISGGSGFAAGGLVTSLFPGFATGGRVKEKAQKRAAGGSIKGKGTGTSDSILAWLSNGEYVMDAKTTSFFGPKFFKALQGIGNAAINPLRNTANLMPNLTPQFATGGYASSDTVRPSKVAQRDVVDINFSVGGSTVALSGERDQVRNLVTALKGMRR